MEIKQEKEILFEITKKAKQVTPKGSTIILFGSRARGDNRKDSDWDILILLDKKRVELQDYDDIAYPLREKGWDLNEVINTILFTKAEWEAKNFTPFHKNVEQEGIVL